MFPIKKSFLKNVPPTSPKRFLFSAFLLALLFIAVFSLPAAAADEKGFSNALISDGYIILRDETPQHFQQGYSVSLIGFGADNILIEFRCNYSTPEILGSIVLEEGETVQCYRRGLDGTDLVLMMTLDKLYLNNSQMIAGFSDVYQLSDTNFGNYSGSGDWTLYADILDDPSVPVPPGNPSNNQTEIGPDLIPEPLHIILIISLVAFSIIVIAVFSNKARQKNKELPKEK